MKVCTRKLDPEKKALWVAALRSGEYEQGDGALKSVADSHDVTYCCLGVACEISGVGEWTDSDGVSMDGLSIKYRSGTLASESGTYWDESWSSLTAGVVRWLTGESDNDVGDFLVEYEGEKVYLSALNDRGVPFDVIADLIEEQL
jgi:hypothetical protein